MSTDALIGEMNAAVARRDVEAFLDHCQPDAVWEHNPGGGSPEEGTYEGRDAIKTLFERILEGWEYMRPVVNELSETATDVYVVRGELHCKHPTAAAEMVVPYEQRVEFRDGLLARGRMVLGALV